LFFFFFLNYNNFFFFVHRKLAPVTTEKSAPVTNIHNPDFRPHQTPHQNPETRNNPEAPKQPRNTETHSNYQPVSFNPKRPRAGFGRIRMEILMSLPDTLENHALKHNPESPKPTPITSSLAPTPNDPKPVSAENPNVLARSTGNPCTPAWV
jgi:hypothetical protein